MNNLACENNDENLEYTTRLVEQELIRCKVDIVRNTTAMKNREVPSLVDGSLTFLRSNGRVETYNLWRAWRYWVVDGPVPLELAKALYHDEPARDHIRAGGFAGGIDPETQAEYHWYNGKILTTKDQRVSYEAICPKYSTLEEFDAKYECVDTEAEVRNGRGVVNTYHIDSELGLRVFVEALRRWYGGPH